MTFEEALSAMKQGKKAKRPEFDDYYWISMSFIYGSDPFANFNEKDFLANDWEIQE